MFKVTAIVHGDQLQDVITNLHKITDEVSIARLSTIQALSGKTIRSEAAAPTARRGRPKGSGRGVVAGTKRGPYSKGANMMKLAREALSKLGTGPFELKALMAISRPMAVRDTAIYQLLRQEQSEGHVKKLGPGQYQRTAKGMASSLGIDQQQHVKVAAGDAE